MVDKIILELPADTVGGDILVSTETRERAEQAAAQAEATVSGMIVGGTVDGDNLVLTKAGGGTVVAGDVRGPQGNDGSNVLPTDTAIAQAISTPGSETQTQLNAAIAASGGGGGGGIAPPPLLGGTILVKSTSGNEGPTLGDVNRFTVWPIDLAGIPPISAIIVHCWSIPATGGYIAALYEASGSSLSLLSDFGKITSAAATQLNLPSTLTPASTLYLALKKSADAASNPKMTKGQDQGWVPRGSLSAVSGVGNTAFRSQWQSGDAAPATILPDTGESALGTTPLFGVVVA